MVRFVKKKKTVIYVRSTQIFIFYLIRNDRISQAINVSSKTIKVGRIFQFLNIENSFCNMYFLVPLFVFARREWINYKNFFFFACSIKRNLQQLFYLHFGARTAYIFILNV